MPKNTLYLLVFLAILASLLLGINIGKKIGVSQFLAQNQPTPTPRIVQPTLTPTPTQSGPTPTLIISPGNDLQVKSGQSVFTDKKCGFSLTFAGSYMNQKTVNNQSTIITNPDNAANAVVSTCQSEIPAPPLPPDKIEDIFLDGVAAKLYHDTSSADGSPRDEVIVTHPSNNLMIIVAGYGPTFQEAVSSFKFLR